MSATVSNKPGHPVRWGFVGAGWIAFRALAPAVHCAEGAVLQAAAARDRTRARALDPLGEAYDDYSDLLHDDLVEAVYISLTNEAHLPWTLRALEAGKHVLCEKPLALDAGEVARMRQAARSANRLLVEASWTRWHPRVRRAQALLATGAIGPVRDVTAGFTFPSVPPQSFRLDPSRGGGALYDLGSYVVGAVLWAVPDGQVSVVDVQTVRHPSGVDLTTSARLTVGEATASVHGSMSEGHREWLRVRGERGALEFSTPAHSSWLAPSSLSVATAAGDLVLHFAAVDAYQLMVEHVSRAVRGDDAAFVPPGCDSTRLAATLDAIRAVAA